MMNLSRRNKLPRSLLVATIVVIMLFLIDLVSGGMVRHVVRTIGVGIGGTVFRMESGIARSGFFSSRASLASEVQTLKEQLALGEERAAQYEALQSENEQLRAMARLATETPGITAQVVSSIISSPYGTFQIGAGSAEGVARGSLVLSSAGFVIGVVSDVGSHSALVDEALGPSAVVETIIRGAAAEVSGSGGGNGKAVLPRGVAVGVGDPVIVPKFGQRSIGIVGNVASTSASASQEVSIRLPVNLGALQFVYVTTAGN